MGISTVTTIICDGCSKDVSTSSELPHTTIEAKLETMKPLPHSDVRDRAFAIFCESCGVTAFAKVKQILGGALGVDY